MNNFLEEKEKLLNSIENNTAEHWKEYYKNVPLDCIFDDLVIDINEIKRLAEENQKYKEVIDKLNKKLNQYRVDLKAYQEKDTINHQNISIGLVGVKIREFEKLLKEVE